MTLNASSMTKLQGVHPDLVKVVLAAAERKLFIVTEGLRTKERQATLVAAGKSQTMRSRHITGHAIDFVPWNDKNHDGAVGNDEISWKMIDFIPIADVFKEEARLLRIPIEWGGDWISFKDGPHIQLTHKDYP
jgi:peptidoglycan L-alanyl-D-glutamate endopeptidase CwlK